MRDRLAAAAGFFLAPAAPSEEMPPGEAPSREASSPAGGPTALRAVVLGAAAEVPPVAAALATEVRLAVRARTALVCLWSPDDRLALDPLCPPSSAAEELLAPTATPRTTAGTGSPGAAASALAAVGTTAPAAVASQARGGWLPPGTLSPVPAGANAFGSAAPTAAATQADADPQPARRDEGRVAGGAARRLATALDACGLPATAVGRLAWLQLPTEPAAGRAAAQRALGAVAEPAIVALAGPRPAALETLLDEAELVVLVTAPDAPAGLVDAALAGLADVSPPVLTCPPIRGALTRRLALQGRARVRGEQRALREAVRSAAS